MAYDLDQILSRGVEEVVIKEHLREALNSGNPLRVKLGIDPTGEKIHIGRAVALWKLRALQDLGHKIILVVGDFTARIGDPSDKLEKRPLLTRTQIGNNLKGYLEQLGSVIDISKAEVRYNSEWLSKLNFEEISELAEIFSVQQMIARRNFKERWNKKQDISLRELFYPIMQGYDSVVVKSDLEIGGTDQLFNLMAGRKIQEHYGQKPQDIMTLKMLVGTDGRKMSTSWGNVINVSDSPQEQYGKIMAMKDDYIVDYLTLATSMPPEEINKRKKCLKKGAVNPKDVKTELAKAVVSRYYGEEIASGAARQFEALFSKKEPLEDLPVIKVPGKTIETVNLILLSGAVKSKAEAKRLVDQGGVKINGKVVNGKTCSLEAGDIVKIGKHSFFRIQ